MRQTRHMLLLFVLMLSAGTMAQEIETTNQVNRPQRPQGQRPPGNGGADPAEMAECLAVLALAVRTSLMPVLRN